MQELLRRQDSHFWIQDRDLTIFSNLSLRQCESKTWVGDAVKSALLFFRYNTAIYEQNLSKPTSFTACAIAMLSRFSLFFVLLLFYDSHSDLTTWLVRLRDSKSKIWESETRFIFYELEIPWLYFEVPRFWDSPKISRDPSFFKDQSIPLKQ